MSIRARMSARTLSLSFSSLLFRPILLLLSLSLSLLSLLAVIFFFFVFSSLHLSISLYSSQSFSHLQHGSIALQCVAVRCSVLQCVAMCCSVLQCVAVCFSMLQCVAVCCSVLSVLHHLRYGGSKVGHTGDLR